MLSMNSNAFCSYEQHTRQAHKMTTNCNNVAASQQRDSCSMQTQDRYIRGFKPVTPSPIVTTIACNLELITQFRKIRMLQDHISLMHNSFHDSHTIKGTINSLETLLILIYYYIKSLIRNTLHNCKSRYSAVSS